MGEYDFNVDPQVHLHRDNYNLEHVFERMESSGLDCAAILSYPEQSSIPPTVLKSDTGIYGVERGERVIKATNEETGRELYLLLGQELETSDGWHLLDISKSINYNPFYLQPLEAYLEEGLANEGLLILDHPFADPVRSFADIDSEKEDQLRAIVKKYGDKISFEWNGLCNPDVRKVINKFSRKYYGDVNLKLERMATEFILRVVPTSDTHARKRFLLNGIGSAHISFYRDSLDFEGEEQLFASMNNALLRGDYGSHKDYVPFWNNFLWSFGLPMLKKKVMGLMP